MDPQEVGYGGADWIELTDRKEPLVRPRRGWDDNIKMHIYICRTAPLTSKIAFYIFIQQIYVQNILNMLHTLRFFSLQNAVYFIMLPFLFSVLFTFYIQVC